MAKLISKCPTCGEPLKISSLQCPDCGLELRADFSLSPFEQLSREQYDFLLEFLRCQGNLKALQESLKISYPNAKKQLLDLLIVLGLAKETEKRETPQKVENMWEDIDMSTWYTDTNSTKASEIIKTKLKECGGRVIVHTLNDLPCEIWVNKNGEGFGCDKLPNTNYGFDIFDVVVDLLHAQNGRAKKGNGRNYRVGAPDCDETTVMGAVAINYFGKTTGESTFDPIFVLAAVLDWAGIAHNERGYLSLTADYLAKLS